MQVAKQLETNWAQKEQYCNNIFLWSNNFMLFLKTIVLTILVTHLFIHTL